MQEKKALVSRFIPIPKKGNAKECSNYCTIALISHATSGMQRQRCRAGLSLIIGACAGWRRAVTQRKGKERWRNKRGEARGAERRKIGEESRRGMGDDRNENERLRGKLEAPLPPPCPAALPPERALQPPALTLSQLRGRHSAWIVFPKLLFYQLRDQCLLSIESAPTQPRDHSLSAA